MAGRIVFLHSSAGLYGADLQLVALAAGLRARGWEPVAVVPEDGPLLALLERDGVEVAVHPLGVLRRRELNLAGAARMSAAARSARGALADLARDAAVVHSNTSVILGGGRAAAEAGIPHVIHVREIYEGAAGAIARRGWPLLRRRLMQADARICVSRAVAAQFDAGGTHVVHDGLARFTFDRPARLNVKRADAAGADARTAARTELGIPADAFTVAILGRIADWKGQDVLARALALPALAEINAIGLVAGDAYPGEEARAPDLKRLRDELQLGDRLRLLGFRDDPDTVLAAADVVAVPSTRPDPFPNSALEALAAGKAVVASNTGGLAEMIDDGTTGLLVDAGDVQALAKGLRQLADDPDRRTNLGAAAAADVQTRFTTEGMLDGVEAVYAQLGVRR